MTWLGLLAVTLVTRLYELGHRVMSHDESLHVYYSWKLFAKGEYQRIASTIGPAAWPKVHEALQHILDGIRSGVFVARPEKSQFRLGFTPCEYCDPDHLGTAERWAQFERKLADPALAAYVALVVGPEDPEEEAS